MPLSKQTASASRSKYCQHCRKSEKPPEVVLRYCNQCYRTPYCNRDCQKADWKLHKISCKINAEVMRRMKNGERYSVPLDKAEPIIDRKDVERRLKLWIETHRPLLNITLVNALTLQITPNRCMTHTLFIILKRSPPKEDSAYFTIQQASVFSLSETRELALDMMGPGANSMFDSLLEQSKGLQKKGKMGLGLMMTLVPGAQVAHATPFTLPAHSMVADIPINLDWEVVLAEEVALRKDV